MCTNHDEAKGMLEMTTCLESNTQTTCVQRGVIARSEPDGLYVLQEIGFFDGKDAVSSPCA